MKNKMKKLGDIITRQGLKHEQLKSIQGGAKCSICPNGGTNGDYCITLSGSSKCCNFYTGNYTLRNGEKVYGCPAWMDIGCDPEGNTPSAKCMCGSNFDTGYYLCS
ncbi:MAG: hypothetical protein QM528_03695 [Phycisphaerales bacterium]|nr:hypothetical protein [Phycisphaerales bacterium]